MAEVENVSLPSGYEYEFVSTVFDEYHCLICHLPLREPVLTRCGHRYCKKCLDEAIRRQQVPECPADREPLDPEKDIFPDKAIERNILSCHVRCPSEGCEWTGETRYVEAHLESCGYKIIHCPNSNCDMTVERRLVNDHVANRCEWRVVHCGYCEAQHAKCHEKFITAKRSERQKHVSECRKFPTDCSNWCGQVIPREEIENHTENDCPLALISCPYLQMGCKTKVQRKQMQSHLLTATAAHLDLACVKLNDTEDQLKNTQTQLNNTQVQLNKTQIQLNDAQTRLNKTQVQLIETHETTRELVEKVDTLQRQLKEKLIKMRSNKTKP